MRLNLHDNNEAIAIRVVVKVARMLYVATVGARIAILLVVTAATMPWAVMPPAAATA